jgi:hypothetical protein
MFGMSCSAADVLFEDYSRATMEFFEASDRLTTLVGRHKEFAEAEKQTDRTHAKCRDARRALEQHWNEHGCHAREYSETNPASCKV